MVISHRIEISYAKLFWVSWFGITSCTTFGKIAIDKGLPPKSYPIHGSDLLWKQELEYENLSRTSWTMKGNSLHKTTSYNLGDKKSWYADDLSPTNGPRFLVPSTCKAVGINCYIFVENASWNTRVNQQQLIPCALFWFQKHLPILPRYFCYRYSAFGNPPNVDGDPKVIILLLDIKDGLQRQWRFLSKGTSIHSIEVNPATPGYRHKQCFAENVILTRIRLTLQHLED